MKEHVMKIVEETIITILKDYVYDVVN